MLYRTLTCFCLTLCVFPMLASSNRDEIARHIEERAFQRGKDGLPAETPQVLLVLFGDEAKAAGVNLRQLTERYEDAYRRGSNDRPRWKRVEPSTGWWVAFVLLLGLVFHDLLKRLLSNAVTLLVDKAYGRLAGLPSLRTFALRRYRTALRVKYSRFPVTFRPGIELEMRERYVPLKVRGRGGVDGENAVALLRSMRCALILGAPGSGKSLLLRSLALAYGENRLALRDKLIPVLVELSSLNDSSIDLEASIAESFARRDFPHASRFVHTALQEGLLLVLLDGFDEIASTRRAEAARHINTLIDRHYKCRFVITCRGPAYHGEFDAAISDELEVVDFTDQQIITFLRPWQTLFPSGKNIEQLMQTLRDRPQIMLLARNPLLLTIVAFLYTDKEFILPNSRAEFYDQATDILLRQWKGSQNIYTAPQKRLVLEHLALYNQSENSESLDRRTITLEVVLRELRGILPKLNLSDDHADHLLNEIVERSALLMRIDNGARYQFPHLTLQEFFAAAALADDPSRLTGEFTTDRDSWREVVKLWCGLEHDSTNFILGIQAIDPLAAFECLADAQKIEPHAADAIISAFCQRFEVGSDLEERVQRAFAAVASDRRPRGAAVFEFLRTTVLTSSSDSVRMAAASALSLTNLPDAATFLAETFLKRTLADKVVEPLIVRMGDVAVLPVSREFGRQSRAHETVSILAQIATPAAFKALLELVYRAEPVPAAAMALGSAFDQPALREAMCDLRLTDTQEALDLAKWVWTPFDEGDGAEVAYAAGRIVAVLAVTLEGNPQLIRNVDARLLSALCFHFRRNMHLQPLARLDELMEASIDAPPDTTSLLLQIDDPAIPAPQRAFLAALLSLPPVDIRRIARIMNHASESTTGDWENLRSRTNYEFARGWHLRLISAILLFCSVLAAGAAVVQIMSASQATSTICHGVVLLSLVIGWHWRWTKLPGYDSRGRYRAYPGSDERLEEFLIIIKAFAVVPFFLVEITYSHVRALFDSRWHVDDASHVWLQIPVVLFTPGMVVYYFLAVKAGTGTVEAAVIVLATVGVIASLRAVGLRREHAARNPLTGVLDISSFTLSAALASQE